MAQTGYTPLKLYKSGTTTNTPLAANLNFGELAINYTDGKLFYKDNAGVVQVLGTKGGVGSSTTTQVLYNSGGLVVGSANLTFDGTKLSTNTQGIANYSDYTSISTPTYQEGRFWYDTAKKALTYYNDATNNAVHVGQETQVKVINNTGSTIAIGSPVYITGTSSGQTYPNIALAKADVTSTCAVIGLTNTAIANGAIGYVTSNGLVEGINTSSYTVGQVLYLSPYSAGQLMNTVPPTGLIVQVGLVSYVNASGSIYVKQTQPLILATTQGGTGLSSYTAGDLPYYVSGTALSKLGIGTAGYVLTSSGTAPQWTNPTSVVGGAAGSNTQVQFNNSGALGASANLTWSGTVLSTTGFTASSDSSFTSTGALTISKGTTGQQPGSPVTGMMRYNSTTNQFEGYSGASPAWKSIGGSALSNDTSSSSNLYPVFASATTGTAENLYASNAKYLYKPSTGELKVSAPVATNGIVVNADSVAADYTIATGTNGFSVGPVTVASGISVTVASGQRWVII